jgi:molybdenum cofactor guanylyltransferase
MLSTTILNGLVLAGGKSSRMGKEKSKLAFHGKPQYQYLEELLKPFCDEVFLSVSQHSTIPLSNHCIQDHFNLESPLNGILSAFHFDPQAAWLTVPVDMPNINERTIKYLLQHRDKTKSATCFYDTEGNNPEPLLTIWEPRSKPQLFDFFNHGESSPRKFLEENDVCMIEAPEKSWLMNINTYPEYNGYLSGDGTISN